MQWLERSSQDAEVDLVLFPGDAVWKKVTQAGEEARVFLLEFPATKQHYFFWMQEPKEEKAEKKVKKAPKKAAKKPEEEE